MKQSLALLLTVALLLITAQRLPAPISEIPETPTPAPAVAPTAEPKKPLAKPKSKPSAEASSKRQTKATATPQIEATRFAGTWSGTANVPPGGNTDCTFVINSAEDSVRATWATLGVWTSRATVNGNAISWRWGLLNGATCTLILVSDGRTARVTLVNGFWGAGSGVVKKQD